MAFKCLNGLAPVYLHGKFTVRADVHSGNIRQRNKLEVLLFRTATCQRSFEHGAVRLWNDLPQTLTAANTLANFKAAFKSPAFKRFLYFNLFIYFSI